MKFVFLFPGQGSQYVGMGKNLYANIDYAKEIYDRSSEILEYDIKKISFENPDNLLNQTKYTQPSIFIINMIADFILKDSGYIVEATAGHSLGEYSALVSADVITFEDALQTIKVRASKMEEISNLTSGKMAAILNFKNIEIINELTHKFKGKVVIANYNSGKQIIISGFSDSVDKFIKEAKNNGINKILPLNVSGAFHSALMNNARIYLEKFIKSIVFKNTKTPNTL